MNNRYTRIIVGFLALAAGSRTFGTDLTWNEYAIDKNWHNYLNWVPAAFPGGGTPARVIDRATIDNGTNMPVTFSSSSGTSPVSDVNENRPIQDLYMIGTRALVALLVTGDTLYVRRVFMISGGDANEEAAIKVTADNAFKPEIMNLTGTSRSRVELIIEKDVLVETETRVTGNVNIRVTDGYFYFTNWLIIKQGKITGDSTFTFPSI
jgi:hypothetical protein